MRQHTPGPWRQNDLNPYEVDATGRRIADTRDRGCVCHTQEERANAEFIVRACNSHTDLLVACNSIARMCRAELKLCDAAKLAAIYQTATAAIAKAKP